jgi:hypothetical protein
MLDLTQIAEQISLAGQRESEQQRKMAAETEVAAALARDEAIDWAQQAERIRASRTSWLVAHVPDGGSPGKAIAAPPLPSSYAVAAADGSQIAPDRHDGTVGGCYLLNVGRVLLRYGTGARARLDNLPELLLLDDEEEDDAEEAVRRAASGLGARRFAREMSALSGMAAECATEGLPAVVLTDGSLIAWHLYDDTGKDPAKQEALTALFTALEETCTAGIPLVGYVSAPGSRDVLNGLRITLCPEKPVECFRCPHPKDALPCAPIRRATDASLFAPLLAPGERSPVFTARGQVKGFSQVLPLYGDMHWIAFFYLNVGAEVARIELPTWAAEDPAILERVHTICLDQASKGRGYPVALAEAHEQAVVRGADREAFLRLLERARVQAGGVAQSSRKALMKRTRGV